jgi:glycosyltransferase involved in cell wall biosynthesis
MERYRIIPLVYLTDLSLRLPRCQAAAVSAMHGLVINFMLPTKIQQIFPHRRLIGPSLMPFSIRSLESLERLRSEIPNESMNNVVRFTGSLYEPRTTFLRQLSHELAKTGHNFEILGREPGSNRVNDNEYWRRLYSAAIVVTTTDQINQSGADWTWVHQLVYRYLEVLVCGSLLLAPRVSGVSRYFVPGTHFVCYESLEDAAEKARYYLDHPEKAEKIRRTGHDKAASLIRSRSFWMLIDTALGFESITK